MHEVLAYMHLITGQIIMIPPTLNLSKIIPERVASGAQYAYRIYDA